MPPPRQVFRMSRVTTVILTAHVSAGDSIDSVNDNLRQSGMVGEFVEVTKHLRGPKHMECMVYLAVFNNVKTETILAAVDRVPWPDKDMVQVFVREQEDEVFHIRYHGRPIPAALTAVEQVEGWYNENLDRLSAMFSQVSMRSFKPGDAAEGMLVIEVESQNVVGTVTFWNKGDVEVLRLDLTAEGRDPESIDDRVRLESEHIPSLLESYFKRLSQGRSA